MIFESSNYTVLIVDDVVANLNLLIDQLLLHGYQVRVAESGESALKRIQTQRPDIVLLDVLLPGVDGFEICRRLKADPSLASIPVIFLTALTERVDKVQGFEAGGVDYMTKPLDTTEVLLRVRTHLELAQLRRELTQTNQGLEVRVATRTLELQEEVTRRARSEEEKGVLLDLLRRQSDQLQTLINHVLSNSLQRRATLADDLLRRADEDLGTADRVVAELYERTNRAEVKNGLQQIESQISLSRQLLRQAIESVEERAREESDIQANPLLTLSEREREVLMLLVNDYGIEEIAGMMQVTGSTVRTYRYRILQKLDVKDNAGLLRFALRYNLVSS